MSFKVTKLIVGKGKTTGDEKASEWTKQYFEVEIAIEDEHQIELAKASVESLIDGWLAGTSIMEQKRDVLPGSEDLTKLPWKSYQTKETAKENEAAWVFANTKGAESLLALLKTKDKATIGNFTYELQGKEKQFISRKPVKK